MNRFAIIHIVLLAFATNLRAQPDYKMAGPYEVIARDGEYRNTKGGSERDMKAALDLAQSMDLPCPKGSCTYERLRCVHPTPRQQGMDPNQMMEAQSQNGTLGNTKYIPVNLS